MAGSEQANHESDDASPQRVAETWAALLAHWTSFARAAASLPKDADGERWRASVPGIIGLQAITMALGDLDRLASGPGGPAEHAVGVDRAAIQIREHAATINQAWRAEAMPSGIIELMEDARAALEGARESGTEIVTETPRLTRNPAELISAIRSLGFDGEAFAIPGGTFVQAGTPIAFLHANKGAPIPDAVRRAAIAWGEPAVVHRVPVMRQVYRTKVGDEVQDRIVPMSDTLPAGQPMLMPIG